MRQRIGGLHLTTAVEGPVVEGRRTNGTVSTQHLKECGKKGGETGTPHPMDGWTPIPDSLARGIGTVDPDEAKVWVWLAWRRFDFAKRMVKRKKTPPEGGPYTRLKTLAEGILLSEERTLAVLTEMKGRGYVEESPDGWRVVAYPPE